MIAIKERARFKKAIQTKLIMEVADAAPAATATPAQARQPRVPSLVGEQLWRERWNR